MHTLTLKHIYTDTTHTYTHTHSIHTHIYTNTNVYFLFLLAYMGIVVHMWRSKEVLGGTSIFPPYVVCYFWLTAYWLAC